MTPIFEIDQALFGGATVIQVSGNPSATALFSNVSSGSAAYKWITNKVTLTCCETYDAL